MYSKHYIRDRVAREQLIRKIGIGTEVATIYVDRNHPAGPELHTVTTTGIIIIRNANTHKVVTKLIARPNQIRRYFEKMTPEIQKIVNIAYKHQQMHYNI